MIKIQNQNAEFCVRAGVLIKNQNYFLLQRGIEDDFWSIPGGKIELMEKSIATIKREIMEELGLEIKEIRLKIVAENFFKYQNIKRHEISFYYSAQLDSKSDHFTEGEFWGIENNKVFFKWVELEELRKQNIFPEFIKKMVAQEDWGIIHEIINE